VHIGAVCGLRIQSNILLPEITDGEDTVDADRRITVIQEPDPIGDEVNGSGALFSTQAPYGCTVHIPGVASYSIESERRVVIRAESGAAPSDIRLFLFGPVLGLLCLYHSRLPLQGTCVVKDRRAVALVGRSGIGTSTLAAGLLASGFECLSDDFVAVDTTSHSARGRVLARPTISRLKLWRESMKALSISATGLVRTRDGIERYFYPGAIPCSSLRPESVELSAVLLVERRHGRATTEARLNKNIAAQKLKRAIYQRRIAADLKLAGQCMEWVDHIVTAVPVHRLVLSRDAGYRAWNAEMGLLKSVVSDCLA
jgi:hypothetical protein